MKFLFCQTTEHTDGEKWAIAGEPVVPNFPIGYANSFLGTESFQPAIKAIVGANSTLDIDEVASRLKSQFPGLPPDMLDTYVLETAKAAQALPLDAECQVYIKAETAQLMHIKTGVVIVLWTRQPIPKGYKR